MDALIKTLTTARQDVAKYKAELHQINADLLEAQTVVKSIEDAIREEALSSYVLAIRCHPVRRP